MVNEHCWVLLGGVNENLWHGRMKKMTRGAPCSVEFNPDYIIKREETKGDIVGWIHTHPGMIASPSSRDHRTMKAWVCSLGKPLVCVIVGIDGLRAYWYMDDESPPIEAAAALKLGLYIVGVTNSKSGKNGITELEECEKGCEATFSNIDDLIRDLKLKDERDV